MPEQGESRIVVCAQPADLYKLRKEAKLSGSADRIDGLHDLICDRTKAAASAHWRAEHRVYAVFEVDVGGDVPPAVIDFVSGCGTDTLPAVAVGIALAPDAGTPLGRWRPQLRSEAVCIAGALADIATANQVLTEHGFARHPEVAATSCTFAPAAEPVTARAIVALARRVEVSVLCTGKEPELTLIGNFPVLRPHLKVIEDDVTKIAVGMFPLVLRMLAACSRDKSEDALRAVQTPVEIVRDSLESQVMKPFLEWEDLADEEELRNQVVLLDRILRNLLDEITVGLSEQEFTPPSGSFERFRTGLNGFAQALSHRIKQGDTAAAEETAPFFDHLAVGSWR